VGQAQVRRDQVPDLHEREQPGQVRTAARLDLVHVGAGTPGDLLRQREPRRDVAVLAGVAERDHREPIPAPGRPPDHLVVVELRQRGGERRHLRVLVELRLPAHRGDRGDAVGAPHDRHAFPYRERKGLGMIRRRRRVGSGLGDHLVHASHGLVDGVGVRGCDPHRLDRAERAQGKVAERGPRHEPTGDEDAGHAERCRTLAERAARGDRQDPAAAHRGLLEQAERLRGLPGVRGRDQERVRPTELRELRRPNDRDRDAQPGRGHGRQHVPRDGRAPHPADRDRGDAVALGQRVRREPGGIRLAALRGKAGDRVEHPARIGGSKRRPVVEIDHRFFLAEGFRAVEGFSASSISMTGIPSRTG
jgi:hypothetical protein